MADEQAAAESLPNLTAPAAIVRHVLSAHGDHEPSDDEVEAVLGTARSLVDALRLGDDADGGDSEAPPLIVREVLAARWAACYRRQSASPGCTGTPPTIALFHGTRAELVRGVFVRTCVRGQSPGQLNCASTHACGRSKRNRFPQTKE